MGATLTQIYSTFSDSGAESAARRVGMWQETDPYDYHVTRYFYNTRLTVQTDAAGGTSLSIAGLVLLIRRRKRFVLEPTAEQLPRGTGFRVSCLNPGVLLFALVCAGVFVYVLIA